MAQNSSSLKVNQYTAEISAIRGVKPKLYFSAKKRKMEMLEYVFRKRLKGNLVIFRKSHFGVEKIVKLLEKLKLNSVSIHSEKSKNDINDSLKRFENGSVNILVITDKAFKGLEMDKVDMIINFDVPGFIEDFVSRFSIIKYKGLVHVFCSVDEKATIKSIEEITDRKFLVEKQHPFNDDLEEFTSEGRRPKEEARKSRKSAGSKKKKKRWY